MRKKPVRKPLVAIMVLILCFGLSGCYYSVPITSAPTSKIDKRVLGKWYGVDGGLFVIERTDDYTYAITISGQKYPAYHSDVRTRRFLNVSVSGKYLYLTYKLEEHGNVLKAETISRQIIPESVANAGRVQQLLEENLHNPKLVEGFSTFAREAPIRKSQLMNALRQLRRGDSQVDIVNQIRIRGVDFQLTPTVQTELEDAGARRELIDTTRNNFRGKKTT